LDSIRALVSALQQFLIDLNGISLNQFSNSSSIKAAGVASSKLSAANSPPA
jgi:hypothetical protein